MFLKLPTPLTLGIWFSQVDVFLSGDLLIALVVLVKTMSVVWRFLVESIPGLCLPCGCHWYHCFYIFPWKFVFHPTYQAERWEYKSEHFVPVLLHCSCWKTVWIWLYIGEVGDSLEVSRSTDGVSKSLAVLRKTLSCSFQSDESVAFLDTQSALTFNLLGSYSTVIVIWWDSR